MVPLPPDEVVAFLVDRGLSATFAQDVAELSRGAAAGELAELTDAVERLTGRPPRDITDFVAEHADDLRRVVPQPV
ncbi:hypothetical protein [Actinomycetospora aeridis]|uniref:Uncharacterized protein n=1 Tax=Actinomycetospora aeridis TaxID=3129231 RepID=A0ABU8NDV9_9PSEU